MFSADSPISPKKSNHIEHFSEEYSRLENKIREYQEKIEDISKSLRDQTLKFDIEKRKHASRIAIFNERIVSTTNRRTELKCQKPDFAAAEAQNNEAKTENYKKLEEVDFLKKELVKIYHQIAESLSKTYDVSPSPDISKMNTSLTLLKESIQKRNLHITEIKNEYAKASQELEEVQKQEDMLFQEKLNLSEKERLIDTRRLQAMQMMADPIDSLSYEEEIVKDAERDAETTEKRFSAKNPILLDDDFSKEISTISLLENENSKRKAILDKKKESVENIKSSFPQNDINYSNKNPKKEKNLSAQQNISTTDMHNVVDQISQRLQKKQKEIDEQEREIDQLSAQNAISRKQKTKIYEEQMKKVEDLNKKCREIELLLLNIDEVGELNEEKRQTVSELETRIAQLKRRIDNAERDKNLNSSNNKQLQILRQKYEDHKKEIEENAERINEMRLSIDELQKIVDESGKALKKRESDVVQLEDQLKVVEAKISQTVETLHNEEDKLDDLLKRMPNAQSEAEDFSDILRKSTELL